MTYDKIQYDNDIEVEKLNSTIIAKKQTVDTLKEKVRRINDRIENQFREREILEKNYEQMQREIEDFEEVLQTNESNVKQLELSMRNTVKTSARKKLENEISVFKIAIFNSKI
jgi:predicted RNase H-like nuclease (RuvC/YqgF family)